MAFSSDSTKNEVHGSYELGQFEFTPSDDRCNGMMIGRDSMLENHHCQECCFLIVERLKR